VEIILLELYPDQIKLIDTYEHIFKDLQLKEPIESVIQLILKQHTNDNDPDDNYVEVSGLDLDETALGLDFTPWQEWLGMDLSVATLENFTELEIIAHCLWEMTFIGFDEVHIQNELSSLQQSIEDLQNMTDEERKANTKTWDEFKKELGLDGDTDI
jgi:DNA gyrase/topoisomerase IV subunit A